MLRLTFVVRQVSEIHRFADFLVGRSAQLHVDGERLHDAGVVIGRRLEHNGDLAVDVRLGEGAFGLPTVRREEPHLNVV